jgi:hypothetical protein
MNTLSATLKQPARWTPHATVATVVEKEGLLIAKATLVLSTINRLVMLMKAKLLWQRPYEKP